MPAPEYAYWPGNSAHCLDHSFACGFIYNHPEETRICGQHEGLLLQWVLQGRGQFALGGRQYAITSGSICLRRPGDTYSLQLDGRIQHARYFLLLPSSVYQALTDFHPALHTLPPVSQQPYSQELLDRLWTLMLDMRRCGDGEAHRLLGGAIDLLCALALPKAHPPQEPLAEACHILSDPARFAMPLPDLAARLRLPYHAFRKQFTARYGISPGKYRLQKRIAYARHALAAGDTIQIVSTRLGFSDIHAFSKQFRAMTGETPGQFRSRALV